MPPAWHRKNKEENSCNWFLFSKVHSCKFIPLDDFPGDFPNEKAEFQEDVPS
jgi:hypothetical protein